MSANAISTYHLTRVFGLRRAVDGLTLTVAAGTIFGLLGPRGAGKTTTLRLLSGLLPPTSGFAEVLGYNVVTQADLVQARTGTFLQPAGLDACLCVEDALAAHGDSISLPEAQARSHLLLTHFGLWEGRRQPVGALSLEMQRRLAIAQIFFLRPALVLLDEPTAGLDGAAAIELRRRMAYLARREGLTIFLATDCLAEATQICDMVGLLHQGALRVTAAPDELNACGAVRVRIRGRGFTPDLVALLNRRAHVMTVRAGESHLWIDLLNDPQQYTGTPVSSAPLVTLLIESGAEVEEVHNQAISLEELYSAFTAEDTSLSPTPV
jgi:ABC-type multidrug transport system ATPase subunit